ncbi:MAG: HPr family phosphocarrier protein [Deltaproteobacteria bacterium]|nr:HPr family phosphocarrier protein [Deltaproteobacteria bacterium]MBW1994700.1 HPr family phosphocarrier protein [Deltaproteobacteria bacterium]MBW2150709.1 HPr family phosphocarrier protein [Deltaproteobacteria bacterium]
MSIVSKELIIVNELGLHARSAASISKIAQKAASNVWIVKDGNKVDASSVVNILTLACEKGAKITIEIDDPADTHILRNIQKLIENGFGEDVN